MTLLDVIDAVAGKAETLLQDYGVVVYRGYPSPKEEKETPDYVCVMAQKFTVDHRSASVELAIDVNIKDDGKDENRGAGVRTLLNIIEHLRQGLLKERTIGDGVARLEMPLEGAFPGSVRDQYPFWLGSLFVKYSLAMPVEEGFDY